MERPAAKNVCDKSVTGMLRVVWRCDNRQKLLNFEACTEPARTQRSTFNLKLVRGSMNRATINRNIEYTSFNILG